MHLAAARPVNSHPDKKLSDFLNVASLIQMKTCIRLCQSVKRSGRQLFDCLIAKFSMGVRVGVKAQVRAILNMRLGVWNPSVLRV
jgi:hypothetical protein